MKFVLASILSLAFAMSVQSSIIPLGLHGIHTEVAGNGLSYTAVSGPAISPILAHSPLGSVAIQAAAPLTSVWPAHGSVVINPAVSPVVVTAPVAVEGSYVAKTRGALHTAPLAGHVNSAAAINVAPAPGTI